MEKIVRIRKAAKILGISLPTIYRRCDDADFPPRVHIGGAVGFKESDLEEYIEENTEQKGFQKEVQK